MATELISGHKTKKRSQVSFFHAQSILFKSRKKFGLLYALSTIAGLFCSPSIFELMNSQVEIQMLIQRTVPLPFTTLMIAVGMYVLNDLVDSDLDKVNSKNRPIPSGVVSKKQAWSFILLTNGAGITMSIITLNIASMILIVPMTLIGVLYSTPKIALMSRFVVKNIAIALFYMLCAMLGITFSYGIDIATNNQIVSLHTMVILGIMIFVGSIVNDLGDTKGDKAAGRRTVPIVLGGEKTVKILVVLLASIPAISWMMLYANIVIHEDNYSNKVSIGILASPVAATIVTLLALARITKLRKAFEDMEFVRTQHKKWFPLHMVLQLGIVIGGLLMSL